MIARNPINIGVPKVTLPTPHPGLLPAARDGANTYLPACSFIVPESLSGHLVGEGPMPDIHNVPETSSGAILNVSSATRPVVNDMVFATMSIRYAIITWRLINSERQRKVNSGPRTSSDEGRVMGYHRTRRWKYAGKLWEDTRKMWMSFGNSLTELCGRLLPYGVEWRTP